MVVGTIQAKRLPVRYALRQAIRLCYIATETGNLHMRLSAGRFIRQYWNKRNTGMAVSFNA